MKRKRLGCLIVVILLIILAYYLFFHRSSKPAEAPPKPVEHVALEPTARYDLDRDETQGGHTLERHIGKTDAELRQRLDSESISTDSTYTDRATAEMAVAAAVHENHERIDRWLHRPGGHSNLVLDYDSMQPIGRSMRRDDAHSFPCSHSVVILKWVSSNQYYVLTSYPECWRPK
ncbi:MAG TPA: RNase A-like domain-containing protein [Terriglobales bacterium]|nr:RNase A-like domain-containing protein [Terriglobales bacterium]